MLGISCPIVSVSFLRNVSEIEHAFSARLIHYRRGSYLLKSFNFPLSIS